jgi:hypothetical protein
MPFDHVGIGSPEDSKKVFHVGWRNLRVSVEKNESLESSARNAGSDRFTSVAALNH